MFINTMAVGPLDPTEFCVTGGTMVAILALCSVRHDAAMLCIEGLARCDGAQARLVRFVSGLRRAMTALLRVQRGCCGIERL